MLSLAINAIRVFKNCAVHLENKYLWVLIPLAFFLYCPSIRNPLNVCLCYMRKDFFRNLKVGFLNNFALSFSVYAKCTSSYLDTSLLKPATGGFFVSIKYSIKALKAAIPEHVLLKQSVLH
jgi:hypothetical protein